MRRSERRRIAMAGGRGAIRAGGAAPLVKDDPNPMPEGDDTTADGFVRVLRMPKPHLSISDAYEDLVLERGESPWPSQKKHMVRWFEGHSTFGGGQYTRNHLNTSTCTAYNRFLSAHGLPWIGEPLGEGPAVVQTAADAARGGSEYRSRCVVVRRHVPWPRILELWRDSDRPSGA